MGFSPNQQLFGKRYTIIRELGRGGFGITYLATNQRGELRVIKTLREDMIMPSEYDKLKQNFHNEALRQSYCRHPHIAEVETVFAEGNLPCMAMEYIDGEDLKKRVNEQGALPEAEALLYIKQIGDALTLIHEKGLLHRDLKPGNIMIRTGKKEAVLIDFGIARQFISGEVLQHTENRTDGYAPPEQYLPDAERGEYIDIYALAGTLYTLLTGQLPMPATARLLNNNLKPPQTFNHYISNKVNTAIMKGMELDYKLRPQLVTEWLSLLGNNIEVVSYTKADILPCNWECLYTIPNLSFKFAISPDGQILATDTTDGMKLLKLRTGKLIGVLTGHSNWVDSVAFSSNGQVLASGSRDRTIKLWDVGTGKELFTLTGHSNGVSSVAFNPNGQVLASGGWDDYTIKLWDIRTEKELRTLAGHSSHVDSVVFSPDGQVLASGSADRTIKLWDVGIGKELLTLSCHSDFQSLAFSPNGQVLASVSWDDDTIKLWNMGIGKRLRTVTGHSDVVWSVAFSPDGQILVSGSEDKTIKLWEVGTGKELRTLTGHFDSVISVAFSPDGQILVSGDEEGNINVWRRV